MPRNRFPFGLHGVKSAQTTVEFSLVIFFMVFMIMAIVDYAQLHFYRQSLTHALRKAGRFAVTGGIVTTNMTIRWTNGVELAEGTNAISSTTVAGQPISREESIRKVFRQYCVIKAVEEDDIYIYSWPGLNNATETNYNKGPGEPEDRIMIVTQYPLRFINPGTTAFLGLAFPGSIDPDGKYLVTVKSIFYSEDFFTDYLTNYAGELDSTPTTAP
jgi:Flp pilus assembly protein TadG